MVQAGTETDGLLKSGIWAERFFIDVMWNWLGVVASFLTGFFLSPYIIHRLGDDRYGTWALAFAFIDHFILFDFGPYIELSCAVAAA